MKEKILNWDEEKNIDPRISVFYNFLSRQNKEQIKEIVKNPPKTIQEYL